MSKTYLSPLPGVYAGRHHDHSSPVATRWLTTIGVWAARSRQRSALGELAEPNDRLLEDIGLSRSDALREAAKPFWKR